MTYSRITRPNGGRDEVRQLIAAGVTRLAVILIIICAISVGMMLTAASVLQGDALYFIASLDGSSKIYGQDIARNLIHKFNDLPVKLEALMLSPDGQHLAFTAITGNLTSAVYMMEWNGAHVRPLPAIDIRDLAWSPDGQQVAYWSGADKSSDIYVMNVDGNGQRRLDTGATDDRNPVWSQDGQQIAYVSRTESGGFQLKVTPADGGEVRCLGDKGVYINGIGTMAWTPDSQQIASLAQVQGRLTIVLATAESKSTYDTCSPLTRALDPMGLDTYSLLLSPDYEHIAFTSNQGGQWGIYVLPAYCLQSQQKCYEQPRHVSQAQGDSGYPSWSPDGKQIAYIVGLNRRPQIWLTDLGGHARPISDPHFSYWSPVWWR